MFLCLIVLACWWSLVVSQQITIKWNGAQASIFVDDSVWLQTTNVWFHAENTLYSTSDGSLKLVNTITMPGVDQLGEYSSTQHFWSCETGLQWQTAYRVYTDSDTQSITSIVFEQTWLTGANNTAVSGSDAQDTVLSSFPTFDPSLSVRTLGAHQWSELMDLSRGFVWSGKGAKLDLSRGRAGGPVILFDHDSPHIMSVFSVFSQFMVASVANVNGSMNVGVMGSMVSVPAGFHTESIIVFGSSGIINGMLQYGDLMLQRYGKRRDDAFTQPTSKYLGFNTDHGGYYYYHTEPDMNYEQTLEKVIEYARSSSIPFHGMLLDSWWYFQDDKKAVLNWTAMPSVFPSGLTALSAKLKVPFIAHNRYWSPHSQYAKQNGGQYEWSVAGDYSLPVEQAFWNDLFANNSAWNLYIYEQDWLNEVQDKFVTINTNITIGRSWLLQMGSAAARSGLQVQYCMPYPRHMLQSVEVPAVTQIRSSNDNVPGDITNLLVGETNLWAYSLGLAPFKDGFWTTSVQPGAPNKWKEPSPGLQAVIATLSCGPVYSSDKYDLCNTTLLSRSHRTDGLILKPDRPAFSLDVAYFHRAFPSEGPDAKQITATYSSHNGYKWHVLVVMMESHAYTLKAADLAITDNQAYLAYYWHNADLHKTFVSFDINTPLLLEPNAVEDNFTVWYLAPVIVPGFVLLGETSKWAPMSAQRVTQMQLTQASVVLSLIGDIAESVTIEWARSSDASWSVSSATCVLNSAGAATLTIPLSGPSVGQCT